MLDHSIYIYLLFCFSPSSSFLQRFLVQSLAVALPPMCPPMESPFSILRTYKSKFVIQVPFQASHSIRHLHCAPDSHLDLIIFYCPWPFSSLSTDMIILLATQTFDLVVIHVSFEPLLYLKPGSHPALCLFPVKSFTNVLLSLSTAWRYFQYLIVCDDKARMNTWIFCAALIQGCLIPASWLFLVV